MPRNIQTSEIIWKEGWFIMQCICRLKLSDVVSVKTEPYNFYFYSVCFCDYETIIFSKYKFLIGIWVLEQCNDKMKRLCCTSAIHFIQKKVYIFYYKKKGRKQFVNLILRTVVTYNGYAEEGVPVVPSSALVLKTEAVEYQL